MSAKMSLAGKKAALSKIDMFATSSDPKIAAIYGPKARKLEAEIAAILEKNPELRFVRTARKGGNGSTANPRRTMAAKSAWITMNKRKLEQTDNAAERAVLEAAIADLENDISEIRRLFPEVDTPMRGGAEIVDREATMSLFAQFADEFGEQMQRIMGIAPAAPVVPREPLQIAYQPAPSEPVVLEGVVEEVIEEPVAEPVKQASDGYSKNPMVRAAQKAREKKRQGKQNKAA